MTQLTTMEQVEEFLRNNLFSFLYISRTHCGVCHALLPQVKEVLKSYPKIQLGYINADHLEEVAGKFLILTVPALLFFVNGREYIREARFVHIQSLQEKIGKIYSMVEDV
jgi:thioredoxin-like negative regulator of GroEL